MPDEPTSEETTLEKPTIASTLEQAKEQEKKGEKVSGEDKVPEPRKYSEEEWNKRQSAIDLQLAAKDKDTKELRESLEALEDKMGDLGRRGEEQRIADWLAKVEADGGDISTARQIAEAQKSVSTKLAEIEKRERTAQTQLTKAGAALRVSLADELIREHKLDPEIRDELLDAEDPAAMENKALKLALRQVTTPAKEKVEGDKPKVDSAIVNTRGKDTKDLTFSERFGLAIEESEETMKKK